jgi:hypothetical protein
MTEITQSANPSSAPTFEVRLRNFFNVIQSFRSGGEVIQKVSEIFKFPPREILNELERQGRITDKIVTDTEISFRIISHAASRHLSIFDSFKVFGDRVPRLLVIGLATELELMMIQMLRDIVNIDRNVFDIDQKKITIGQLRNSSTIEAVLEKIIEDEIDNLFREDLAKIVEFFCDKFQIAVEKIDAERWKRIQELFARRNIYVHNDGISNDRYQRACIRAGIKHSEFLAAGQLVQTDQKYFNRASRDVLIIGIQIMLQIWRKYESDKIEKQEDLLNHFIFTLIDHSQHDAAISLAKFALHKPKNISNDRMKKVITINMAQALEHFPIMLGRIRRRRSSWCIRLD